MPSKISARTDIVTLASGDDFVVARAGATLKVDWAVIAATYGAAITAAVAAHVALSDPHTQYLQDAPSDGSTYARNNGAWAVVGGGIADAPSDGVARIRRNAAWEAGSTYFEAAGALSGHTSTFNHASYDSHVAASAPHAGHLDTADLGVSVQAFDADTAKTDVDQQWTAGQGFTPQTGPASGTASLSTAAGNRIHSTLTGNITTVNVPTMDDGETLVWWVTQGGSGGYDITGWNAAFKGVGAFSLTGTLNGAQRVTIERVGSNYHVTLGDEKT